MTSANHLALPGQCPPPAELGSDPGSAQGSLLPLTVRLTPLSDYVCTLPHPLGAQMGRPCLNSHSLWGLGQAA